MCNFMDSGRNGLHLAHAFPDGDALLVGGKIAVRVGGHRLKLDGNRGRAPQGFQKGFIVRHSPRKAGGQLWQGLAIGLAHIKHLNRAKHGDFNFFFLHDRLTVCIQNGGMGVRLLHIDEHGVVHRITVKLGHDGQIAHILFALEQLLDTLFDTRRDFLQPFPVGGLISHDVHSPL